MRFFLHLLGGSIVVFVGVTLTARPVQAQGAAGSRVMQTLREAWRNDTWQNLARSEYHYDANGQQSEIWHLTWQSGAWRDTTAVMNSYNAQGRLAERLERRLATDFVLSHELYEYNENGEVSRISFPDTPWFRARVVFDVYQIPFTTIVYLDPYPLTSHVKSIEYEYSDTGLLEEASFTTVGDLIPDSIFVGPKLHPLQTYTYPASQFSNAYLEAYKDSMWVINPVDDREVTRTQRFSYQTNGKQISAVSQQTPPNAGELTDKLSDFYEIWHPCEVRTIWFYDNDERDEAGKQQFSVAHLNPLRRTPALNNQLNFWLRFDIDPAIYNIFVNSGAWTSRYFTSKLQDNLSFGNTCIPGNFYQYTFEPRFQQSYPIPNKMLLKTVEQLLLPVQKTSSPEVYGFSWDFNFQWIDNIERNFEYDDAGRLLSNVIKTWEWERSGAYNPETGHWENDSKYEFFYDGAGNGSMILVSVWNTGTQSWENRERVTFTYEAATSPTIQTPKQFDFRLANHPNPFNAQTTISFRTEKPAVASLQIYDVRGRLVDTILTAENLPAADHSYSWDGRDSAGRAVASGLYLYRLQIDNLQRTGKCLFVK